MNVERILKLERVIHMKKTTLQLETVTCPSCIRKIEGTVSRQKGVSSAIVKFNSSKVEIDHDEQIVSADALKELVSKLGYTVLNVR